MLKPYSAISISNLHKSFGDVDVLKGVNLEVKRGSIVALLGPNGAGKTTIVKILATLLKPDSGTAIIDNYDVVKQSDKVRTVIGLTGQAAAVDDLLTGKENLIMMGRLYRLTSNSAKARAQELLERFDLVKAANRPAKTYSGGMRRRLDLAVSLIATPPIIFLDEPTTGLDPRSRLAMWDIIKELVQNGTTILLTTQYLEEADQLADKVVVIDGGKVIAEGTPNQLKKKVGKDRLVISLLNEKDSKKARTILSEYIESFDESENTVTSIINDTDQDVRRILETLAKAQIKVSSISVHKPTLDDVFLSLTGKQNRKANK